jgi:hypothetical protein
MTRAQRVAVLVGVLGVLAAVALALLPVSHSIAASGRSSSGGGIYGGVFAYSGDPSHCGSAAVAFFKYENQCHEAASDRLIVSGVVAGFAAVGAGAAAWLLAPARQ